MKRSLLVLAIIAIYLLPLSSATFPDKETKFNIFFIKKGTNTFGLYSDVECTSAISTVDFDLLEDATNSATAHTPFYIGWTIYDEVNGAKYNGGRITIRTADTSDTYNKDVASDINMGYGLSYTDKYKNTIGLNYNVRIINPDDSSTMDIISISSDNINKQIVAGSGNVGVVRDERSGSFEVVRNNLGYMNGVREVKLTIDPPQSNAAGLKGFMSVGYSGIFAVILEVN